MDDAVKLGKPLSTQPSVVAGPSGGQALRVWPVVVLLVAFWAFLYVHFEVELAMFNRFISRMIAFGVLLLGFLAWWLSRRQVSLRGRLLPIGVYIASAFVAGLVADKSVNAFALFMSSFPYVFTGWTVWILLTRNRSPGLQTAGLSVVALLVLGYFSLLRWEGLDGNQRSQFSWRWNPTAEEQFLASRSGDDRVSSSAERDAFVARPWQLQPGDWPEFRGAQRDGVVTGVKFDANWADKPPQLIWRQRVGPAWSSMIIVDGFLVTQEQRGESEAIVCYDAETGNEVWAHLDEGRFFESLSGAGPRGTPTFSDGRIFALGARGRLTALSAPGGQHIWSRDVVAEAGGEAPQWGYSVSPLAVGGMVIVFGGGEQGQSLSAYDAATGEPVWQRAGGKQSYSSPHLLTIRGERHVLMHDNRALSAYHAENGELLWERSNGSEIAIPMLQPQLVDDGQLLISDDPGIALVNVEHGVGNWTVTDRWTSKGLKPSFNDFVMHNGFIYGLDDGILCCVDLETGKRIWKKGRYGHGQMLLIAEQGLLVVLSEKGEVVLVAANPEQLEELGRFQAIEGKTWNHPVISHGRLYVRNGEEMACYQLSPAAGPSRVARVE